MNKQTVVTVALAIGFIFPIMGTAYVIWHSETSAAADLPSAGPVFLEQGPGYNAQKQAGMIEFVGNYAHFSNLTVILNHISGTGEAVLLNVLAGVNNRTSSNSVSIWLNGTLPSNVTLYLSNGEMESRGSTITGSNLTSQDGTFSDHIITSVKGIVFYGSLVDSNNSTVDVKLKISYTGSKNANLTTSIT